MTRYLCLLVQEYEAVAGMTDHLPPEKRTFGHRPFLREGESPRQVLTDLLMASGGAPYIAAVFDTQARLPEGASFAQTVDIALLAGKFNERAVRDYHLSVQPNEIIMK